MDQYFNLLIVDDDEAHVALLRILMQELHLAHNCYHAANGLIALDFLNQRQPFENVPRPHLILLDLNMPHMNGSEFLRLVKADERFRSIPVIMLSSSESDDDVETCYTARANAYIRKPTDLDSNMNIIRELDRFWFSTARLNTWA